MIRKIGTRKQMRATQINGTETVIVVMVKAAAQPHGTSDQEIRSLHGVPGGYSVLNLVAIGEKAEEKRAYTETDLHTGIVHYERY